MVTLKAVGPETEPGVVVRRDAVKQRSPESLASVWDVAESEAVQHQSSQQNHKRGSESDASKGSAHPPDTKFIQGLTPVQPSS